MTIASLTPSTPYQPVSGRPAEDLLPQLQH